MTDLNSSKLIAHRQNVARYRRLLRTPLNYDERRFIQRRLAQEQAEIDRLEALGVRVPPRPRQRFRRCRPDSLRWSAYDAIAEFDGERAIKESAETKSEEDASRNGEAFSGAGHGRRPSLEARSCRITASPAAEVLAPWSNDQSMHRFHARVVSQATMTQADYDPLPADLELTQSLAACRA